MPISNLEAKRLENLSIWIGARQRDSRFGDAFTALVCQAFVPAESMSAVTRNQVGEWWSKAIRNGFVDC